MVRRTILIPRILGSRAATMLTFATLSALLLSACQQEAPAPTPSAETPAVAPAQPVVQTPALKELDAQARKVKLMTGRLCNIETVDDAKPTAEATVPKDVSKLGFAGWIGDEATGKRAENARLLIQTLDRLIVLAPGSSRSAM
jgi:hypothetical protein